MFFFPQTIPFVFIRHPRTSSSPLPPPPVGRQGPECGKTTNPNSGYKLQTCLWLGSAGSPPGELTRSATPPSLRPLPFTGSQPQLHPCQPALWTTPGGTQGLWPLAQLMCGATVAVAALERTVASGSREIFLFLLPGSPRSYAARSEPGQVLYSLCFP